MIKRFVLRLLASAAVIFAVAYFSHGQLLDVSGRVGVALQAALALGFLNAFVLPVVRLLAFPLTLLSLGLFSFVLNAGALYGVEALVAGFHTVGFVPTLIAAVAVSMGSSFLGWLVAR